MISIIFVGDGPRDGEMVPPIVSTILRRDVRPELRTWPRLHEAGRGYDRKLIYLLMQARDEDIAGVVATVDGDRDGKARLDKMRGARDKDREKRPPLPTVLGCALPHAEAWLLDDPAAVRTALDLPPDHVLPTVRMTKSPKSVLDQAMSLASPSRPLALIARIACALTPERCAHKQETGFAAFAEEIASEFAPI